MWVLLGCTWANTLQHSDSFQHTGPAHLNKTHWLSKTQTKAAPHHSGTHSWVWPLICVGRTPQIHKSGPVALVAHHVILPQTASNPADPSRSFPPHGGQNAPKNSCNPCSTRPILGPSEMVNGMAKGSLECPRTGHQVHHKKVRFAALFM